MRYRIALFSLLLAAGIALIISRTQAEGPLPSTCYQGYESCKVTVPGTQCGDGTTSTYLFANRNYGKLLIWLRGGGACWSGATCAAGTGFPLSATNYNPATDDPTVWAKGVFETTSTNPMSGWDIVYVPYCTGDVYSGNRTTTYDVEGGSTTTVRHKGYSNMTTILADVKKRFANPTQIAFGGDSAGGIGAMYNLRQVRTKYPDKSLVLINDSGLPAKPDFVSATTLQQMASSWGWSTTFPSISLGPNNVKDLSDVLRYNIATYPNVREGLIQAYWDPVAIGYGVLAAAPDPGMMVFDTMQDVIANDIGTATFTKYFMLDDAFHSYAYHRLPYVFANAGIQSATTVPPDDYALAPWLTDLVNGNTGWTSVSGTPSIEQPCQDVECSEYDTPEEVASMVQSYPYWQW